MVTILRFILFFLLAPLFAVVAQTAAQVQDDFRIVDAGIRAELVIPDSIDGEFCNYDSSGALFQQLKSIDGRDDLSRYQELEASGAERPLFVFSTEFVAANKIDDLPLQGPPNAKVRTSNRPGNQQAVELQNVDGSVKDISPTRVKEFVPNTHPNAPPGALNPVKFDNALPGSKGKKRAPTQDELDILRRTTGG